MHSISIVILMADLDDVVQFVPNLYTALSYAPPHNQHTVLAAFILSSQSQGKSKVISLATGTKCLPTIKYPERGEALHDCHAEIVARRAALRWFLEEITRHHDLQQSPWICLDFESGKYHLCTGTQHHGTVATSPAGGDASMRYLAASQDEEMARLKDSSPRPVLNLANPPSTMTSSGLISRGRDGYSRLGVLRTKPGRADSPSTFCMSCSDKMATWNVHGIQGALGSYIMQPLYIDAIVIGDVSSDDSALRQMIEEDCGRAFWGRVANVSDLPCGYSVHKPVVRFTNVPFVHSKAALARVAPDTSPTNESLCWIADRPAHEVLINGFKRGVSPKHRFRDKSRPLVCKLSMYQLLKDTLVHVSLRPPDSLTTYIQFKQGSEQYQSAKRMLRGSQGPFPNWIQSGFQWESFYLDGKHSIDIP